MLIYSACDLPFAIMEVTVIVGKFVDDGVGTVPILGRHGSASLCRDGQKTKWRLQCKY